MAMGLRRDAGRDWGHIDDGTMPPVGYAPPNLVAVFVGQADIADVAAFVKVMREGTRPEQEKAVKELNEWALAHYP